MVEVEVVTVFADGPGGGNPAPVVLDAGRLTDAEMQDIARRSGHESAFVVDSTATACDLALRFWVPNHEMEMCGHATLAAVWLLAQSGRLGPDQEISVHTASGAVRARVGRDGSVLVHQPVGRTEIVSDSEAVLAALGLAPDDLADRLVRNATTSRTKTLVPVRDMERLDAIRADPDLVDAACAQIGSTGLYPYALSGDRQVDARQFPRDSGYPEDPATGIAAAALTFGLLADGLVAVDDRPVIVRQGRAMGRPSRIAVRLEIIDGALHGCWLGGSVARADEPGLAATR